MSDDAKEIILAHLVQMSPADISSLEAAHARIPDETFLGTAAGSNNDVLWSKMAALGWMTRSVEAVAPEGVKPTEMVKFKIEEAGIKPIGELLARRQHGLKMIGVYNKICADIVRGIVEPVREAGGKPIDIATFIANITAETVNYAFKPEHSEKVLDDICVWTKARLKTRLMQRGQTKV